MNSNEASSYDTIAQADHLVSFDPAFLSRAADDAKEAIKLLDEAAARRSHAPGWLLDQALAFWADCDAKDWLVLDECTRRFQGAFL